MTAPSKPCLHPTKCNSLLEGKGGKHGGHEVLYGVGACWRRDGRPERKVGLSGEGWESPFEGGDDARADSV